MSAQPVLSRRAFLEVSALVGGGLLLGFQLGTPRASAAAAPARFVPNAWISVGTDGAITLICHRNEMGQDVHTSLAMLMAEELSVDPRGVKVVQAPVDPAHFTNALLGAQITGGSTSVRDAWEPLRRAGASARTMLVGAGERRGGAREARPDRVRRAGRRRREAAGAGGRDAEIGRLVPRDRPAARAPRRRRQGAR
jgi:CO/xanthine dehydrogenase Mo-binding subunit